MNLKDQQTWLIATINKISTYILFNSILLASRMVSAVQKCICDAMRHAENNGTTWGLLLFLMVGRKIFSLSSRYHLLRLSLHLFRNSSRADNRVLQEQRGPSVRLSFTIALD
jgi:hypothetical protein